MSTFTTISSDKLARLIGTANAPVLIDVRTEEDFAADRRLIPGSIRLTHESVAEWGGDLTLHHRFLPARRQAGAGHSRLAEATRR